MKEYSAIEWIPIRVENGEYIGNLPNIDENNGNREFLVTYVTGKHRNTETDIWNDSYNWFENFNVMGEGSIGEIPCGIIAWANLPEYYKGE